jgi:hypothetical protein
MILTGLPLKVTCLFNILSLFCILSILTIIYYGEVLFWSYLSRVLISLCTWMSISCPRLGKFSFIISLNNYCMPLFCISGLHQRIIFILLIMSRSLSCYDHDYLLFYLFVIWKWSFLNIVFFIWFIELFISKITISLRISISLLNFSFKLLGFLSRSLFLYFSHYLNPLWGH